MVTRLEGIVLAAEYAIIALVLVTVSRVMEENDVNIR
jgi:hypothetical protein